MTNEPDDALFNFKKVRFWEKKLTEADTRVKVIDEILKNSLGWTESDIQRETHVDGGFVDYVLSIDELPRLVIEAKSNGDYFNIPLSMKSRRYKLSASISKVENAKEAIEQARNYCLEKGVKYGIVTNGSQFIVFQAFAENREWRQEDCIVFRSFQDVEENFHEFWNILSKHAVRLNSLRILLRGESSKVKYIRPLDNIHNKDEILVRNHLAGILDPFIHYIFEEITDDSKIDVLKNCYIFNKSFETTDEHIRGVFADRIPLHSDDLKIENFIEGEETAGMFQVNFYKCTEFLNQREPEGSVVILLGGVGSGKTTFLHRFFKIVLYPEEKVLWFYVDFRTAPTNLADIRDFLIGRIVEHYEENYSERLRDQLERLGLYKTEKTLEWLTKLFAILKVLKYTLSIVIDNVDQHYQLYPEMQQKVFVETQHLTDALKTITILSLREESFFRHGLAGAFGAYYVTSFHVTSPNFNDLLLARANYLLEILKLPEDEIRRKRIKARRGLLKRETEDLGQFFEIIRDSFAPRTSTPKYVARFVESVAGSNMRKGLEMFSSFLFSGNTKVYEMLQRFRTQGSYTLAHHQVMKSIMLGDSRYYSSKRSYVMNLFDVNPENTGSHFLNLKILQYAKDRLSYDTDGERGYVSIEKLKQDAEKISINKIAVEESLGDLARFGLVIFDNQNPEKVKEASLFSITPTGIYYLDELSRRLVYLDLVWIDTPIADESVEKRLRYMAQEVDMSKRFERTRLFLDYLAKMEKIDFEENPQYYGSDLGKHKFTGQIIRGYEKDVHYIEARGVGRNN
jgi:hypothetical protein